jgi:hypothetical protein
VSSPTGAPPALPRGAGAANSILEDAAHSAVSQSAEVMALREGPEQGRLGGVAVTLRL